MLAAMAGEPDDNALMLRYRAGDTVAFQRLYARHKGPLFRFFLRQCGHSELAGDLFQEVWTRIIKARLDYEPRARFTTYMYQIARNILKDEYRRQQRRPADTGAGAIDPDQQASAGGGADAGAENLQAAAALRTAIAALPDDQREAFLLREEAGLSLVDIAVVTGVPEETAKSRLRYALGKLRQSLLDQGAWP
jgi:RNA polymerase sigma-70 factor (ECF subfamily)